jgi:hypothetical protein
VRTRATGWLLDPQTVVTSGHCVHRRGRRLVSVDVVMGHGTGGPVSRPGTHVIAHWGWFRDYETDQDLALIRIVKFDNEVGLKWRPFPENEGKLKIFAVGYPSFASEELRRKKIRNDEMQKSEDEVPCKTTVEEGVLEHTASTWNGTLLESVPLRTLLM